MIIAAGLFVAEVVSLALIIRELRKAPEGYEDEHGFYIVHKGAAHRVHPTSATICSTGLALWSSPCL
jgi:hypothetical protein